MILLDPRIVRMPPLAPGTWLNTPAPLTKQQLMGQVVLVDFWDYTCINCIRTLPYLRAWHGRYAAKGLLIIGIHTPEFKFAQNDAQVVEAIREFSLPYPVLIDAAYENWTRFANRAWPTKYLIDERGYIRFQRQGEGYYNRTEQAIQMLLRQRQPGISLPELMPALSEEDSAGAVCFRTTPELYAGYQGGGLFGGALGNPEGYVTDSIMMYSLPEPELRREGQFFVEGFWQARPESLAFAGQDGGRIILPYQAAGVNAVLSPSGDDVALMLNLWAGDKEPLIEVRQDGASLSRSIAGKDVVFDANGRSYLHITRPRLYAIVANGDYERHALELIFRTGGIALYAFTFNTCVARGNTDPESTFKRS